MFHLLFHETLTTRYALPLVPVVAYLAVRGLDSIVVLAFRPAVTSAAVAIIVIWSLMLTLPAVRVYARDGSPAFAALRDLHIALESQPDAAIGMHQGLARPVQTQDFGPARVLSSPPMREWLELAAYWRAGNRAPVWFLADPARTDIELIDPLSRKLQAHYIWGLPRERFMSGVRPDIVDLVKIDSPPGWFAEEGWHLTSETLNMSESLGRTEGVAYIRSRSESALLVLGGESTSPVGGEPALVSLSIGDRAIDRWSVPAGSTFFKRMLLAPGTLTGTAAFDKARGVIRVARWAPGEDPADAVRHRIAAGRVSHSARGLERDRIQQGIAETVEVDYRASHDLYQWRRT